MKKRKKKDQKNERESHPSTTFLISRKNKNKKSQFPNLLGIMQKRLGLIPILRLYPNPQRFPKKTIALYN